MSEQTTNNFVDFSKMSYLLDCVAMARIAEQAERYEDMKKYIKLVATTIPEGQKRVSLSLEERSLFSLAYKDIISPKRSAWRILSSIQQKSSGDDSIDSSIADLKEKIERELEELCQEVQTVISEHLLRGLCVDSSSVDDFIYYMKMKGDYYRYEAEFMVGDAQLVAIEKSRKWYCSALCLIYSYREALKEAENLQVSDVNPTLLGLYLNYSVFLYEITRQSEEAREMATKAFENAMKLLENLPEKDYQDSVSILQLIRDNLKLWESETEH